LLIFLRFTVQDRYQDHRQSNYAKEGVQMSNILYFMQLITIVNASNQLIFDILRVKKALFNSKAIIMLSETLQVSRNVVADH